MLESQVRLEPEVWQQGGVGPEGAPGRKVKKVFRLEEKSGEQGKKKGGWKPKGKGKKGKSKGKGHWGGSDKGKSKGK